MHMKEHALSKFNYCQPNKNIKKLFVKINEHVEIFIHLSDIHTLVFRFFACV
jgi:hypothetical protein